MVTKDAIELAIKGLKSSSETGEVALSGIDPSLATSDAIAGMQIEKLIDYAISREILESALFIADIFPQ